MQSSETSFYKKNWRWFVLGTLFLATFLNYFDRQTLGNALDPISDEFGLNLSQRGKLISSFIYVYAITHFFIGIFLDRVKGIRWLFPVMVIGWSVSNSLVYFAQGYTHLIYLRSMLGVWEAVNFPICLMIIARIFPAKERTLAVGIFGSGAAIATILAPSFVIYCSSVEGLNNWRLSFILSGLLGFVWLIPWFMIFKNPEKHSKSWQEAIDRRNKATHANKIVDVLRSYQKIIKSPAFWGLTFIGFGIVPSVYFATQWFPTYFTQGLNHDYDLTLGPKLSIIYFTQDLGLWIGGAAVLYLSNKGLSILKSRKIIITVGFLMMLSILFLPSTTSFPLIVIILCVYVFGFGTILVNQHAFKQDIIITHVATVAALIGGIETLFAAFINDAIGEIVHRTGNFNIAFYIFAGLACVSFLSAMIFLKPKWLNIK